MKIFPYQISICFYMVYHVLYVLSTKLGIVFSYLRLLLAIEIKQYRLRKGGGLGIVQPLLHNSVWTIHYLIGMIKWFSLFQQMNIHIPCGKSLSLFIDLLLKEKSSLIFTVLWIILWRFNVLAVEMNFIWTIKVVLPCHFYTFFLFNFLKEFSPMFRLA